MNTDFELIRNNFYKLKTICVYLCLSVDNFSSYFSSVNLSDKILSGEYFSCANKQRNRNGI